MTPTERALQPDKARIELLVKALIVAENQLLECSDKWTNVHTAASDQDWDLVDEIARDQQSECAKALATVKAALQAAGEKP